MMGTKLDKSNIKDMGEVSDAKQIEKVVDKADTTLKSVEAIAGKVENIVGMIARLKEMGENKSEPQTSLSTSIAPKIESGVQKGINEEIIKIKNTAKIKIDVEGLKKQLDIFLKNLDQKKTVKQMKKEIDELMASGVAEKVIEKFVLDNCEVEFK